MNNGQDEDVDRETYYQPAADLWDRGCRGEKLDQADSLRFRGLARDRFYTFVLSIRHSRLQGDTTKVQSLVRSLALDLIRAPGLELAWHDSEFSVEEFGELVTAMIPSLREQG